MNISIDKKENETIITVEGRLDTISSKLFEAKIQDAFITTKQNLILDCKGLEYISSSGLRAFLLINILVKEGNKELVILNMQEMVLSIFKMTGFDKLFRIE